MSENENEREQERDRGGGGVRKEGERERDSWQINFYCNLFSKSSITYQKQRNVILTILKFHSCLVIP